MAQPNRREDLRDKPLVLTRSCGTNQKAGKTVNLADLKWADIVLVMEQKHRQRFVAEYPGEMHCKALHILDIPDNYRFMDTELIDELTAAVEPILAKNAG